MKTKLLIVVVFLAVPVALASFDSDGNGLSDLFEFIYFHGTVDPAGDPDGDGNSILEEMVWGTDPTQAASRVSGATAYVEGADLVLVWTAAAGKWYRLQACEDLQTWETVDEGHIATHRQPLDDGGLKFWRVQVFGATPDTDGNGFDDWEEALWKTKYGDVPGKTDLDGDGLPDAAEFTGGHNPDKRDHPAVGLIVFTPLEK